MHVELASRQVQVALLLRNQLKELDPLLRCMCLLDLLRLRLRLCNCFGARVLETLQLHELALHHGLFEAHLGLGELEPLRLLEPLLFFLLWRYSRCWQHRQQVQLLEARVPAVVVQEQRGLRRVQ